MSHEKPKAAPKPPKEDKAEQAAISHPAYQELEDQLTAAEAKANEHWEKLLRCQADIENTRYRSARDLAEARKFALKGIIGELLNVVDNLERTLDQKVAAEAATLHTGVELTLKLLQDVLEKNAVKPINPIGEAFDPALHEAMSTQPDAEKAPGTVLAVLQKGYLLYDRLLRPALVVVAKTPE